MIKNDAFGSNIYAKISKNYNLNDETGSIPNPSLSPLVSESSKQSTTAKSDTSNRYNNAGIKRQHHGRKDEKRGNFSHNNEGGNRNRRYSHSNQQGNNMQMQKNGGYNRHNGMPNQAMYAPMRNEMMAQGNYGPAGMMQPGFFMAQPQMYNQYYNYPATQQGMYYPKIY